MGVGIFASDYHRSDWHTRDPEREKEARIVEEALNIKQQAEDLANTFPNGSDTKIFLNKLAAYLQMRSKDNVWSCEYAQLSRRTLFIGKCLKSIGAAKENASGIPLAEPKDVFTHIDSIKQAMEEISNLLAERKIKPFKGLFSQKMYDIMKTYQDCNAKRQSAINSSLCPSSISQASTNTFFSRPPIRNKVDFLPQTITKEICEYDENSDFFNNETLEEKSNTP